MNAEDLVLEVRDQTDGTVVFGTEKTTLLFTPPVGEDYWRYRVVVADGQAVIGFPKFGTIGVGFQVEEDWNTNLPSACVPETILNHIRHNKGDESITDEVILAAIRMIAEQSIADSGMTPEELADFRERSEATQRAVDEAVARADG